MSPSVPCPKKLGRTPYCIKTWLAESAKSAIDYRRVINSTSWRWRGGPWVSVEYDDTSSCRQFAPTFSAPSPPPPAALNITSTTRLKPGVRAAGATDGPRDISTRKYRRVDVTLTWLSWHLCASDLSSLCDVLTRRQGNDDRVTTTTATPASERQENKISENRVSIRKKSLFARRATSDTWQLKKK